MDLRHLGSGPFKYTLRILHGSIRSRAEIPNLGSEELLGSAQFFLGFRQGKCGTSGFRRYFPDSFFFLFYMIDSLYNRAWEMLSGVPRSIWRTPQGSAGRKRERLRTAGLRWIGSKQTRSLPFCFQTGTMLLTNCVGSCTGRITPFFSDCLTPWSSTDFSALTENVVSEIQD